MSWEVTTFVLAASIDTDIAKAETAAILADTPHFVEGCGVDRHLQACEAARAFFEAIRDGRAMQHGCKGSALAWSWHGNGLQADMLAEAIDGGLQRLWRAEAMLDFEAVLVLAVQEQGAEGNAVVLRAGHAPMRWRGTWPEPLRAWESWDGWGENYTRPEEWEALQPFAPTTPTKGGASA